jgi:hypothetical protein
MRKLALFGIVASIALVGCKKNTNPSTSTYPTDNLTVSDMPNVFVLEKTGAWCQYCPNGAEAMKQEKVKHGDRVLGFAAHEGDALENNAAKILVANFLDSAGYPTFLVNNENSGQDIANNVLFYMNPTEKPHFAVAHVVQQTDDSLVVYPKIEILRSATLNENFFVQSFLLIDGVEARDYGNGIDLNQVSSVPKVSTGSGANPTKWVLDAAEVDGEPAIKAGDVYTHDEVVAGVATNTADFWGHNLGEINPFGNEFLEGDVLGTKHTPIMLSIQMQGIDYKQFNAHLSVATIIWKFRSDGSGRYDYVNGYLSHLD